MVDSAANWDFYKIPTIEILQYRSAFYRLRRPCNQPLEQWLTRIKNCLGFCQFPLFYKYLLMDRFICGLTIVELKLIQSAGKYSTLEELLAFITKQTNHPERITPSRTVDVSVNQINQSENAPSLELVKFEPVCLKFN